jgi:hypothetical protein
MRMSLQALWIFEVFLENPTAQLSGPKVGNDTFKGCRHPPMTPRKHIQLHFDVADEAQAAELSAAWEEIVAGKRTRISTAAEDTNEIMEQRELALRPL